jgi:hypothetical protein
VSHDAGHLDLVHRENHAGRAAGLAELVAHIGDIADADTLASQRLRHLDTEETLAFDGLECFGGKPGGTVDRDRVIGGDRRYGLTACEEILRDGGSGPDAGLRNLLCFHYQTLELVFLVGGR